jgi:hypothetical protein
MMPSMRSTVRIDDDLLNRLKEQARRENISLTQMLNRTLRAGLLAPGRGRSKPRLKQPVFAMGAPRIDLTKALTIAADTEDEALAHKLALRK